MHNALWRAGADCSLATRPEELRGASRLVVPGVGAAGHALAALRRSGVAEALAEIVEKGACPVLGICVGMQIFASTLHEFGEHRGLGWVEGDVVALSDFVPPGFRVPHMGWNTVEPQDSASSLFKRVRGDRSFYFCHSFGLRSAESGAVAAVTEHGEPMVAAIQKGTLFATQFHPENSQVNGSNLIRAFLDWSP